MRPLLCICALIFGTCAFAQGPTPVAKPDDVKSIDSILAAIYGVISNPPGGKPDWDRFRSLFAANGRLIAVGARGDAAIMHGITPEEYVKLSGPFIEKNGFIEKEIARRSEQYGNIAEIFSTYESRLKKDDPKPFERGINSFQLFNDGKRW